MKGFSEADVPDQSGKCFLITGANTGLGFEASRVLAHRGARVLLGCRNPAKADHAIKRIRHLTPDADLAFLPLDLADLDSVRIAAAQAMQEPRLDVLVNNAGVMFPPLIRTRQGFQPQLGVNTLGPFALTALLLPKLSETQGSRIVINSSMAHRAGKIDWDDLNAERSYSRTQRYYESKLANLLLLMELDRRLRDRLAGNGGWIPPRCRSDRIAALFGSLAYAEPAYGPFPQYRRDGRVANAASGDIRHHSRCLLWPARNWRNAGCIRSRIANPPGTGCRCSPPSLGHNGKDDRRRSRPSCGHIAKTI